MAFRRKLTEKDLLRMRIPRRFWDVELDGVPDASGTDAEPVGRGDYHRNPSKTPREICRGILENMGDVVREGWGLLLWGRNGVGKTGMAVVVLKEARRRGHAGFFMEAASLKRAVIEKEQFDEDENVWERALNVQFLVLDDLGKGTADSKGFGERLLDELVRHRSARKLNTVITTNMNPREQLPSILKASTLHSLKECAVPVRVFGPDQREDTKSKLAKRIIG